MKKALSILLSLLFLFTALPLGAVAVSAAKTPRIYVTADKEMVRAGDTVRVYVNLADIEGWSLTDWTVEVYTDLPCDGRTIMHGDTCHMYHLTEMSFDPMRVVHETPEEDGYCDYAGVMCLFEYEIPEDARVGTYPVVVHAELFAGSKAIPVTISNLDIAVCDTTGDCTWMVDGTHLTISGNGAMGDYTYSPPWRSMFIKSVTIEDGVTTIGENAFRECYLGSVTIPDSVTTIGKNAFRDCYTMTSVTIPDSVVTIGDYAFADSGSVIVGENNPQYSSVEGALFDKNQTTLIHYPEGKSGAYTIPDSVIIIEDYAFYGCHILESVTIPDSVTTIGDSAFEYCDILESVTIPVSVTAIGKRAFRDCDILESVYYGGSEEDRANIGIGTDNETLLNATWHYSEVSAPCDHVYDNEYDTDCNACGAIREAEMLPVAFGGNSVSEDVSGLAFQFTVDVIGMTTMNTTTAVYDNATLNGYKLLSMGAIVSNAVESVDILAVYLFDWSEDSVTYVVRLIEIPSENYDTTITAIPYFVLEMDGVATTIYGEAQTASMNSVMDA